MPIVYPHLIFQIDAILRLLGMQPLLGAADFMFNPDVPILVRFVSLNHAWLLYFLLFVIWRLGYDRRAFLAQSLFAAVVIVVSYLAVTDMHAPVGNINKVFGLSDGEPQTFMAQWLWLIVLVVYEFLNNAAVHALLRRFFPSIIQPFPPQTLRT